MLSAVASRPAAGDERSARSVGRAAPRPAAGAAASPRNDAVDVLVRENLDAELREQPVPATWLGVHVLGRSPRRRAARSAGASRRRGCARCSIGCAPSTTSELDATARLDRAAARASRRSSRSTTLTELRPLERNPAHLLSIWRSRRIDELVTDDFMTPTDRLRAIDGAAVEDAAAYSTRRAATCARPRARAGGPPGHRAGAVGASGSSPRRCRRRCRRARSPS